MAALGQIESFLTAGCKVFVGTNREPETFQIQPNISRAISTQLGS
jgi:hypothetical protein